MNAPTHQADFKNAAALVQTMTAARPAVFVQHQQQQQTGCPRIEAEKRDQQQQQQLQI